jgi:hypothetical protein
MTELPASIQHTLVVCLRNKITLLASFLIAEMSVAGKRFEAARLSIRFLNVVIRKSSAHSMVKVSKKYNSGNELDEFIVLHAQISLRTQVFVFLGGV